MSAHALPELVKVPVTAWGFTEIQPANSRAGSSFRRILFAVSASDRCKRAITLVAALARTCGSDVHLIHLYERICVGRGVFWGVETPDEATRFVNGVRADLEQGGVRTEASAEKTSPDEIGLRIVWAAAKCGADMIVIGSRGESTLRAAFRGSISHEIIRRSKIPVLVVP